MSFSSLLIGNNSPEIVNAIIEIPRGSRNKYEYDNELDLITLDRVLHSPLFYPSDYGFIPQTLSEDGDPLDILVLITQPTFPGCVLQARPIGVMDMEDEEGKDWKIIAIAAHDPYYAHMNDINDVNIHLKKEIQHFFESYKHLEANKRAAVLGWYGKEKAHEIIKQSHKQHTIQK